MAASVITHWPPFPSQMLMLPTGKAGLASLVDEENGIQYSLATVPGVADNQSEACFEVGNTLGSRRRNWC